MAEAIIAPVGIISRAQRYKKAVKKELPETKICVFLRINIKYIAADIQSIAVFIVSDGTSRTVIIQPIAISMMVSRLKNVREALHAVL